jgi:cytochrome c-type biogenesis protein
MAHLHITLRVASGIPTFRNAGGRRAGSDTVHIAEVGPAAYAVAFGGGVISFLSPCVLPLVPGYLSIVTGFDIDELQQGGRQRTMRTVRTTGLFIGGFTAVFILLGVSASTAGRVLFRNQLLLTRVSGVVLIAMALFMIGSLWLRAPWLYREARFHPDYGRFGVFAPAIVGVALGFGWSPCIGPILGSILGIAATQGRAWSGGTLLAAYGAGLGLPFLITGLAFNRLTGTLAGIRRHLRAIVLVAALSLGGFGVLLLLNQFVWLTTQLQNMLSATGLKRLVNLG